MTPEQNEQWQKAINPLGLGFSEEQWQAEYALAALLPAEEGKERVRTILGSEHLRDSGVPSWAIDFRETCIFRGREATGAWWPGFALRSESALIGIQILYPGRADSKLAYKRVYIRFIREALQPFVEWVIEQRGMRLIGYRPLISLYDLCESIDTYKDYKQRANILRIARARREHWLKHQFFGLELVRECYRATNLVVTMTNTYTPNPGVMPLVDPHAIKAAVKSWYKKSTFPNPHLPDLIRALNWQHQWRLEGQRTPVYGDGTDYIHLIAAAYLTALEAECPRPEWLALELSQG